MRAHVEGLQVAENSRVEDFDLREGHLAPPVDLLAVAQQAALREVADSLMGNTPVFAVGKAIGLAQDVGDFGRGVEFQRQDSLSF